MEKPKCKALGFFSLSKAQTQIATLSYSQRSALPNSRILLHQASGGAQGQASDVRIQTDELLRLRDLLVKILAEHTGNPKRTIVKDTDRDHFMSAEEAIEYGLIDRIIPPRG